jgi:hypothetical protein
LKSHFIAPIFASLSKKNRRENIEKEREEQNQFLNVFLKSLIQNAARSLRPNPIVVPRRVSSPEAVVNPLYNEPHSSSKQNHTQREKNRMRVETNLLGKVPKPNSLHSIPPTKSFPSRDNTLTSMTHKA